MPPRTPSAPRREEGWESGYFFSVTSVFSVANPSGGQERIATEDAEKAEVAKRKPHVDGSTCGVVHA